MQEIDERNARQYLLSAGLISGGQDTEIRALPGGVSNQVLLIDVLGASRFVLKQARGQLRVPQPWFCSIERIWREVDVLKAYNQCLEDWEPPAELSIQISVPQILHVDRENYLFLMSAAETSEVWKSRLLRGRCENSVAQAAGALLGRLHSSSWNRQDLAVRFADRSFFDALRVDPYYRHVARNDHGLRPAMDALEASLNENVCALVHGDFSPKNLLVSDAELVLLDFEVGHYGDPGFDLGFLISHLLLKSVRTPLAADHLQLVTKFWLAYTGQILERVAEDDVARLAYRGVWNCAACLLARVDGKSQVEYLNTDQQATVRRVAQRLLLDPPANVEQLIDCWCAGVQADTKACDHD